MASPLEVVNALKNDRISGFNLLYSSYAEPIYRRITSYTDNSQLADKITSDTLLMGVGNIGRLTDPYALPAWLDAICDNEALKNQVTPTAALAGQPLPDQLHGEVAASLGHMLQSGFLPDLGAVDERGFPVKFDPEATTITPAATDPMQTQVLDQTHHVGEFDSPPGPPAPIVGSSPIIPPVADDDPVAVPYGTETKNRRWLLIAVVVAVVVLGLGIFGVIASGIGTSSGNDEPIDVPTLPPLTPTVTAPTVPPTTFEPTTPPVTPTTPTPTTPTPTQTTPTASPTTPTGSPTNSLSEQPSVSAPAEAPAG